MSGETQRQKVLVKREAIERREIEGLARLDEALGLLDADPQTLAQPIARGIVAEASEVAEIDGEKIGGRRRKRAGKEPRRIGRARVEARPARVAQLLRVAEEATGAVQLEVA